MMKSILLVMSLSGTSVLILQIIISLAFKQIVSAKTKYFLLKLSIIFYLLPLPLIKNYYIDLFRYFFNIDFGLSEEKIYFADAVLNSETGNYNFSPAFMVIIIMLIIIYLVVAILVVRQIMLYCILKLKIHKYSAKVYDKDIISIFDEEKKKLKLKRKITIKISEDIETPMTTGFIHPVILIPKKKITKENLVWILKHELTHIYNCDYIYILLCIIAVAVHWFNPFVYLLFKQVSVFSEFNCDESIVKNLGKEQRINYGCTILNFSAKTNKRLSNKAISMLGSYDKKVMKERLIIVKRFNKRNKFEKAIQSIIIISTLFISSLTVFAYQEPEVVPVDSDCSNYDFKEISLYSGFGELENTENKLPDFDKTQSITYYFTDKDNVISKIDEHSQKAPCNHTYKSGYVTKHILDGKGGCTMEYYNSQKCTKCSNIVIGTKYKTEIYEKCPH